MHIRIAQDTITPELERLIREAKRPRVLFQAAGKAVQVEISAHLKRLQARGNAKGWPPQHFFSGRPTSVEKNVGISYLSDKQVVVSIADPRFVHRIEGGTVTAKRKKNLAIPLTAQANAAAGRGSIRESMPGLVLIKTKDAVLLCIQERAKRGSAKGTIKSIIPAFVLVKKVTHRPHPNEMPDRVKLGLAARNAMFTAARLLFKSS